MKNSSLLVIGAGIAGLSAGCYAQMNGFASQIFEAHSIPGGLCTSWRRHGYLFDGAIRYLVGVSPNAKAYPMWQELGALHQRSIFNFSEFFAFEDREGQCLHFYTDPYRFEQHLLQLSPQDSEPIYEFSHAIRAFAGFDLPIDPTPDDAVENLQMGLSMLPLAAPLLRWNGVSVGEFAAHFRNPLLRQGLLEFMQFTPSDFPMMMVLTTLAQFANRIAGYPIGGSLDFAQSIARRYEALGGEIHYQAPVRRILSKDRRVYGIELEDGSVVEGDIVISAADGHATIFDLLGGEYVDDDVRNIYQTMPVSETILQISLGVARDFSNEPPALSFPLARPIALGQRTQERLVVKHYAFDPTMADSGKSVLTLWCQADYDYWKELRRDLDAYEAAKAQIGQEVVAALDQRYPGLAAEVEALDVATPVTYERYTSNRRGAIHGWAMSRRKLELMMGGGMRKTLHGLRNFYMAGQWVEPGGNVQLAAASGRDCLELICRHNDRAFVTFI